MSRVTTWARKLRLPSATQKLVLMVLADHADVHTWSTIAGQELIAEEAALSTRRVRSALAALDAMDVIHRERRHRRDGTRTSDRTTLNRFWQPPQEAEPGQSEPETIPSQPEPPSARQPEADEPPTGRKRQTYRTERPGNRSPVGPPDTPYLTLDVDLSSRELSRPDQRSRSRSRRPPDTDPRILAACQLLAARDLADRRRARLAAHHDAGRIRHVWGWHAEATRRRLAHDGPALADLARQNPHEPASALVELFEPDDGLLDIDLDPWATQPAPSAPDSAGARTPTGADGAHGAAPVIDLRPPNTRLAAQGDAWNALHRARQETA